MNEFYVPVDQDNPQTSLTDRIWHTTSREGQAPTFYNSFFKNMTVQLINTTNTYMLEFYFQYLFFSLYLFYFSLKWMDGLQVSDGWMDNPLIWYLHVLWGETGAPEKTLKDVERTNKVVTERQKAPPVRWHRSQLYHRGFSCLEQSLSSASEILTRGTDVGRTWVWFLDERRFLLLKDFAGSINVRNRNTDMTWNKTANYIQHTLTHT